MDYLEYDNDIGFFDSILWICIFIIIGVVIHYFTKDIKPINNSVEINVVKVIDGDTIKAKVRNNIYSIRLLDIDAPELSTLRYGYVESGSLESKKHLSKLLEGGNITALFSGEDVYGRKLAWLFNGNTPVNNQMVIDGYAKDF